MKNTILLLILIILIGSSLRIYDIGKESLWFDEPHTIYSATEPTIKEIISTVNVREFFNPPLYYIVLHNWIELFGDSVTTIRLFSALFSILSIILIYAVGKEWFNKKVGLLSSFIFSISILEILYAQEARSYAFFSFTVLLSAYFFIKIIKNNTHHIPYILSSIAMLYSLPFGFIVLFIQNYILFFFHPKKTKNWIRSQLALFVLFIPEIPTFLKMFQMNFVVNLNALVLKYGLPKILNNNLFMGISIFLGITIPTIILFYFRKNILKYLKKLSFNKVLFIILFIIASIVYFILTPIIIEPFFLTRYILFMMPFIYILISAGILKYKKPFNVIMILIILLLCARALSIYYPETTKEDWESAASFVEENIKNNEVIVVCTRALPFYYYFSENNEIINLYEHDFNKDSVVPLLENKNMWFVYSPPHTYKKDCTQFFSNKNLEINKTFKDVNVEYYYGG